MNYPFEQNQGGGMQFAFPRLTRAVKVLLIANVAIQLVQFALRGQLSDWFGVSLDKALWIYRLLTYQFVHSISLGHVFMNMLVLYFFGTMVEERIGTRRFVRLYLWCGVAGGLLWLAFAGLTGRPQMVCVGASGAVYGILATAALLSPQSMVIFLIVPVRLWIVAAILAVFAVYNTLLALRGDVQSNVADAAHFGGMAFAFAAFKLGPAVARWKREQDRALARLDAEKDREREKELDGLLARVKEVGMSGLTKRERKALTRYSRDKRG